MSEKRVPDLRFKGFSDDWEERKFADFIDVKSGKDYKHLNSGPIPVYGTGGYMLSVDRALSDIDAIGIGRKGTIDKPYLLKAPFWTVDTLFYAVPKQNIDLQFSLSIFKKINWKKFDESTGVPSLSKTVINSVGAFVPSYEEQQKIGSFFKQLDETIALHQRKLELIKQLKQGFLQQMFVREDEKGPVLRFADFESEWEQRKLGALGSVVMNKRIFKEQTSDDGDVPFYKIGTFGSEPDAYISYELFLEYKEKYPYPEIGDILLSASGSIGRSVVYEGKDEYFQDSNIIWLKHDERLDNKFLKQFYLIVKWQGLEGSTIKRLYNKNILDTNIFLPSPTEQGKIGCFFEKLDTIIALHHNKLEQLQSLKKGYLKALFI
ncbi:restriction endonuclease subunit S [Listeria grayi]|uniref:Type I restriction modification DNA specificity domain protein n=1 Tax=Listeria grayi DSM 20601 TaxID=525367 RepID=D7UY94_LISGR|nr:restriction endonuclease subunit S [Listeria grayi]EFI83881.1 type I restriction modification DNA specificity domain protein [Listeria grayi DSM 20601]